MFIFACYFSRESSSEYIYIYIYLHLAYDNSLHAILLARNSYFDSIWQLGFNIEIRPFSQSEHGNDTRYGVFYSFLLHVSHSVIYSNINILDYSLFQKTFKTYPLNKSQYSMISLSIRHVVVQIH